MNLFNNLRATNAVFKQSIINELNQDFVRFFKTSIRFLALIGTKGLNLSYKTYRSLKKLPMP